MHFRALKGCMSNSYRNISISLGKEKLLEFNIWRRRGDEIVNPAFKGIQKEFGGILEVADRFESCDQGQVLEVKLAVRLTVPLAV